MKLPYQYQEDHLKLFIEKNTRRLPLFWQMRVGKSPTTIWWLLNHKPQPRRVLIVCPKSVIVSWKEELSDLNISHLILNTKNKAIHEGWANLDSSVPYNIQEKVQTYSNFFPFPWFITNYECLTANNITLHKQPWDAIILDESTKIMNPSTRISNLLCDPKNFPLSSPSYYFQSTFLSSDPSIPSKLQLRACLAGKPNPESDLNFFQQFKFLYGGMGKIKNYWEFRKAFFRTGTQRRSSKYIPKVGTTRAIARYLERNAYILTRKQLGNELPSTYEKRFVELPPHFRRIYDEFEKNWYSDFLHQLLKDGLQGQSPAQLETKFATVAQNYLHQLACGFPKKGISSPHKINEVIKLLQGELKGEKVVIWCRYLNDIAALKNKINNLWLKDKLPTQATILKGGMTTADVEYSLKKFRLTEKMESDCSILPANYMICQVNKASMGMDLSAANTQIFFSRSWSHLVNEQAKDRLIHPAKSETQQGILTLDIIAENTVDEDLYHALLEKKANSSIFKWFLKRTSFKLDYDTIGINV